MVRVPFLAFLALILAVAAARAQETVPVAVFVTEGDLAPEPATERLADRIQSLRDERQALQRRLRREHGENMAGWPPQAVNELHAAADAQRRAEAQRDYQPPATREALGEAVQEYVRGARKSRRMAMATSREEASLVVEVTGRRADPAATSGESKYFLRYRLLPGPKMTAARFFDLTRAYDWSYWAKVIARPTADAGHWDLESASAESHKQAVADARQVLDGFVEEVIERR